MFRIGYRFKELILTELPEEAAKLLVEPIELLDPLDRVRSKLVSDRVRLRLVVVEDRELVAVFQPLHYLIELCL